MKKAGVLIGLMLVIFMVASLGIAEDKGWFDMANCDFCNKMSKELMDNMKYEQHRISNGVLLVTTFKPEFKEEFMQGMKAMEQLGMDMTAGKVTDVKMCGHCEYYGKLIQAGAHFEHISAGPAEIDLITSDNPEIQKMISIYADNNDKAMAEVSAMEKK